MGRGDRRGYGILEGRKSETYILKIHSCTLLWLPQYQKYGISIPHYTILWIARCCVYPAIYNDFFLTTQIACSRCCQTIRGHWRALFHVPQANSEAPNSVPRHGELEERKRLLGPIMVDIERLLSSSILPLNRVASCSRYFTSCFHIGVLQSSKASISEEHLTMNIFSLLVRRNLSMSYWSCLMMRCPMFPQLIA